MVALLLVAAAASAAVARPGMIDRGFGENGTVELNRVPSERIPGLLSVYAEDMATGIDGKIAVLSTGWRCDGGSCGRVWALTRYLPDGSVDPSFGDRGVAVVPSASGDLDTGLVAVDSQGGALVLRRQLDETLLLQRLDRTGGLDRSFGQDGAVVLSGVFRYSSATLRLAPDGRIVVASMRRRESSQGAAGTDLRLWRLSPDGDPDVGFGDSGSRSLFWPGFTGSTIAVEAGGGILVGGLAVDRKPRAERPRVFRVRANGSVDRRFAVTPRLHRPFKATKVVQILVRRSGKIDVVGEMKGWGGGAWEWRTFVIRLRRDGTPARRFGRGGIRGVAAPVAAAALDGRGRLVGVGRKSSRLTAFRLLPGGRLDRSFGSAGRSFLGSGSTGRVVVAFSAGRPIVFDERTYECRGNCPPAPVLIGLRGDTRR